MGAYFGLSTLIAQEGSGGIAAVAVVDAEFQDFIGPRGGIHTVGGGSGDGKQPVGSAATEDEGRYCHRLGDGGYQRRFHLYPRQQCGVVRQRQGRDKERIQ